MRIVAATTDEEMLHTIIGAQILGGTMDYRGFSNMKGFEQFRAACRAGDVQYGNGLWLCGADGKSDAPGLCKGAAV